MPRFIRTASVAALAAAAAPSSAFSQSSTVLPPVIVVAAPIAAESLAVPTTERATRDIQRTPGGVEIVPDTAYKSGPALTIKDVLDYVPGVFAQPKWGDDTRLSIRGSSLSRNFHLRSIQLYMDGIPINTADGYGDFQEIDPTAYRYVEVYKGANALQFGGNSLGGAINFVTPSGRDASLAAGSADVGSFGFYRFQASSGAAVGPVDYFATASWQEADGFRDHSWGESARESMNLGYQLTPDIETRFYLNANHVRQRIPGEVSRGSALTSPRTAAAINVADDWQRNLDTLRLANKTTLRLGPTIVEFGAVGVDRHLMHPIFQWLDYCYNDYGGFARVVDERSLAGHANRLVAGFYALNGEIDNKQFVNSRGLRGALLSSSLDDSENYNFYVEESFYVVPQVALVAGTQYLHAVRDRKDRFLADGDQSGRLGFGLWSPKGGLLWDIDAHWQGFANISRSAEVPSFGEGNFTVPFIPFTAVKAQTATTYEIGTRGQRPDFTWDVALYRAEIKNELQCLFSAFGNCNVTNVDRTVHQGIEAGLGASVLEEIFVPGAVPDRLWVNLAYTFNDFRFDGDPVFGSNQLPGAPRHFIRGELLYKQPSGVYAGPNIEWVPEAYFADSADTLTTQGYAIFGVTGGVDLGEHLSAYVEGRNLADKAYISSASVIDRATSTSALFNPGNGRAFYAGVRAKW